MTRLRHILLCLFCASMPLVFQAQDAKAVEPKNDPPKKEVKEETIDSIWGFTKYLGNKLGAELKTRLNLEEEKEKTEEVKVNIKIGKFKVERTEQRPI